MDNYLGNIVKTNDIFWKGGLFLLGVFSVTIGLCFGRDRMVSFRLSCRFRRILIPLKYGSFMFSVSCIHTHSGIYFQ